MSRITFGKAFDVPEAEVRRGQRVSAFESMLQRLERRNDAALEALGRMCHQAEIEPWFIPPDHDDMLLLEDLRNHLEDCRVLDEKCLEAGLHWFDETYRKLSAPIDGKP